MTTTPTEAITRLRDLHRPRTYRRNACCVQCGIVWPCPTRLVLDDVDELESARTEGGTLEQPGPRIPDHTVNEEQPADDDVNQLLVHPTVWPHLEVWLASHGITVSREQFPGDGLPTYVMTIEPHGEAVQS